MGWTEIHVDVDEHKMHHRLHLKTSYFANVFNSPSQSINQYNHCLEGQIADYGRFGMLQSGVCFKQTSLKYVLSDHI